MKSRLEQIWAWIHTDQGRRRVRFTMVSVVSTGVSFAAVSIFYGTGLIPGVVWSTLAGNLVATIPSYQLNRTWTWGKRGRSHWRKEIIPFWAMSLAGIGFALLVSLFARHEIRTHDWGIIVRTGVVAGSNLLSFVIFWFLKFWIFSKIFHMQDLALAGTPLPAEESTAKFG